MIAIDCYDIIIVTYYLLFTILPLNCQILKIGPVCPREEGFCVTSNGGDQNSGVFKLNSLDGNTPYRQEECLKLCRSVAGVTGCEVIWDQWNRGCYAHTQEIASGNGVDRHFCWVFSKCEEGLYNSIT